MGDYPNLLPFNFPQPVITIWRTNGATLPPLKQRPEMMYDNRFSEKNPTSVKVFLSRIYFHLAFSFTVITNGSLKVRMTLCMKRLQTWNWL